LQSGFPYILRPALSGTSMSKKQDRTTCLPVATEAGGQ
jgi:hypothetical protein